MTSRIGFVCYVLKRLRSYPALVLFSVLWVQETSTIFRDFVSRFVLLSVAVATGSSGWGFSLKKRGGECV